MNCYTAEQTPQLASGKALTAQDIQQGYTIRMGQAMSSQAGAQGKELGGHRGREGKPNAYVLLSEVQSTVVPYRSILRKHLLCSVVK